MYKRNHFFILHSLCWRKKKQEGGGEGREGGKKVDTPAGYTPNGQPASQQTTTNGKAGPVGVRWRKKSKKRKEILYIKGSSSSSPRGRKKKKGRDLQWIPTGPSWRDWKTLSPIFSISQATMTSASLFSKIISDSFAPFFFFFFYCNSPCRPGSFSLISYL